MQPKKSEKLHPPFVDTPLETQKVTHAYILEGDYIRHWWDIFILKTAFILSQARYFLSVGRYKYMDMDMDIAETALRSGCNSLADQTAISLNANDILDTTDLVLLMRFSRSWGTILYCYRSLKDLKIDVNIVFFNKSRTANQRIVIDPGGLLGPFKAFGRIEKSEKGTPDNSDPTYLVSHGWSSTFIGRHLRTSRACTNTGRKTFW